MWYQSFDYMELGSNSKKIFNVANFSSSISRSSWSITIFHTTQGSFKNEIKSFTLRKVLLRMKSKVSVSSNNVSIFHLDQITSNWHMWLNYHFFKKIHVMIYIYLVFSKFVVICHFENSGNQLTIYWYILILSIIFIECIFMFISESNCNIWLKFWQVAILQIPWLNYIQLLYLTASYM
jgi:hypothetical protein